MARTQEQIHHELTTNAPSWVRRWSIGRSLLRAAAAVMASVEETFDGLREQLFADTADDPWIEDLGKSRGVRRFVGESVEDYAARLELRAQGVTLPNLQREVQAIADHYLGAGYTIRLVDAHAAFAADISSSDVYSQIVTDRSDPAVPKYLLWLFIPKHAPRKSFGSLAADIHASDIYAAGDGYGERRLFDLYLQEWIEEYRAAGVRFGITVVDTVQPVHLLTSAINGANIFN